VILSSSKNKEIAKRFLSYVKSAALGARQESPVCARLE
jgi:hypothetical protein